MGSMDLKYSTTSLPDADALSNMSNNSINSLYNIGHLLFPVSYKTACYFEGYCNCSVPSQLRAKIHSKSAVPIGFLPSILSFLTVSAVNAQTY